MSRTSYNSKVLVGNWRETSQHEKERENVIHNKIRNENLLTFKAKKIHEKISRVGHLSFSSIDHFHYGDQIQICDTDYNLLSVNVTPNLFLGKIVKCQQLQLCLNTPSINPYAAKTAFIIRSSATKTSCKPLLRYGDNFMLCTSALENELYLSCRSLTSGGITNCKPSDVFLDKSISEYALWNLQHADPQWRVELVGSAVQTKDSFIIFNTFTNQLLTILRLPEMTVAVCRDRQTASLWKFNMGDKFTDFHN